MTREAGDDKELYAGLIRLHILHHAAHEPIFGLGIIEELARHGYKLSAGTLYPLLHGLEQKGYLCSSEERNGRWLRKVYRATPLGQKALEAAKEKVRELFGELFEDPPQLIPPRQAKSQHAASRRSVD
jgi:DNA-binding PadR family transcriptional regulator